MPTQNNSFHNGHRERLRQKFHDGKITDYEYLELLLTYAIPRRDVREPARALSRKFGCTARVINAPIEEITKVPGIAKNTAIFLKAIHHATLLHYELHMQTNPIFHDDAYLKNYCRAMLDQKTNEEFHVLYLDFEHRLLESEKLSVGYATSAPVDHMHIAKRAVALSAHSVVLVHNHPISTNCFSKEDCATTQEIINTLSRIGVTVYDHILVAGGLVYSYKAAQGAAMKEIEKTSK